MFRNMFQEPKPKDFAEMTEALDEAGFDASECVARVEFNEDEGMFAGWTAEIMNEDGETISTLGYESRDNLIKDLHALGIGQIDNI